MKIKWKQINRGIILAVVLAVGTAGYVLVQNAEFKKSIPEISDRAAQIGQEMAESNIGSGDAVRRKQRAFVQNSFKENDAMTVSDFMGMSFNKNNLLYYLSEPAEEKGEVLSVKYEQISSSVNKSGSVGANVKVDYTVSYECLGTPELLGFNGFDSTEFLFDRDEDAEGLKTIVMRGEATLYMLPEGGEWRVVTVTSTGWDDLDIVYPEDEGGEPVG